MKRCCTEFRNAMWTQLSLLCVAQQTCQRTKSSEQDLWTLWELAVQRWESYVLCLWSWGYVETFGLLGRLLGVGCGGAVVGRRD